MESESIDADKASGTEVLHVASCRLPTPWATFELHGFQEIAGGREHVALTLGDVTDDAPVLTRVHSECLTGDALFSRRCDCGPQLEAAMLRGLGIATLKLMTNNPRKVHALERYHIAIAERIPHVIEPNPHNAGYLRTKAQRLGHLFAWPEI
jgi:GTP cyclohydrolase II